MPKSVEQHGLTRVSREVRDGQVVVKQVTQDDHILASNKAMREHIRTNDRDVPLQPKGAKLAYWFQAPPIPWKRYMKSRPDIAQALHGTDQFARERAAQTIAAEHPEWVVAAPHARRVLSDGWKVVHA